MKIRYRTIGAAVVSVGIVLTTGCEAPNGRPQAEGAFVGGLGDGRSRASAFVAGAQPEAPARMGYPGLPPGKHSNKPPSLDYLVAKFSEKSDWLIGYPKLTTGTNDGHWGTLLREYVVRELWVLDQKAMGDPNYSPDLATARKQFRYLCEGEIKSLQRLAEPANEVRHEIAVQFELKRLQPEPMRTWQKQQITFGAQTKPELDRPGLESLLAGAARLIANAVAQVVPPPVTAER